MDVVVSCNKIMNTLKSKINTLRPLLLIGLFVFGSFYFLAPSAYNPQILSTKGVHLKAINVSKENKWSSFRYNGDGVFHVHPGDFAPVIGELVFNKAEWVTFHFGFRDDSKMGNIRYTVSTDIKKLY